MESENGHTAAAPKEAQPPRGINHVVLTVKNLEESHRFWTEILGFRQVAEIKPKPGRPPLKMRFYSGLDENGDVNHHDIALMEVSAGENASVPDEKWGLHPKRVGLNHVAITWPDRESWLKQIAFMQAKGVTFHIRTNHGMTHSAYISDPNGHGVEVLYELPREVWGGDIDGAQNYSHRLPTEGPEALVDTLDNPVFGAKAS
jgi:catechol 2,3-dioxygenase-like lactoylglutathione lyase family enzyme